MDGHGLSIEGGRATRCHGRVQKRLGTRYRNAGVSWWGEGERRYVSSFPFPSSSSTLSFSLSLPPFGWSLRLEAVHSRFRPRRQGLSISWPDRCGSGSSQHSIRPRLSSRERLLRNFVLRDIRQEMNLLRFEGQTRTEKRMEFVGMNLNRVRASRFFLDR